ncbi:MAG: hypothetical protein Q8M07_09315 [Prosthecobacter sp.]|nr:hypothetical protein [Prosthecobacter sp.]
MIYDDSGRLWILGMKTEKIGTIIENRETPKMPWVYLSQPR